MKVHKNMIKKSIAAQDSDEMEANTRTVHLDNLNKKNNKKYIKQNT